MSNGADLTYGEITLLNVLTLEFSERTIRDPSGTDRWYNELTLRVMAIINPALLSGATPGNVTRKTDIGISGIQIGGEVAGAIDSVLCALGKDRQALQYSIGGNAVVDIPEPPDVDNGPKVIECTIVHITPQSARIIFAVRTCQTCCDGSDSNPIINHRWTVIDDLDSSYRTIRRFQGLIRLRPLAAGAVLQPHNFRDRAFPPLAFGFKRESMHFAPSVNGLELAYQVTDVEMIGQGPPKPATSMVGQHIEIAGMDAKGCISRVYVRLDAPKGADKQTMIERCSQILEQKCRLRIPQQGTLLRSMQFIDHFGDGVNAVEGTAEVAHMIQSPGGSVVPGGKQFGSLFFGEIGKPLTLPDYDDQKALFLGPFGTASFATLFACYLQDPCGAALYYGGEKAPTNPPKSKKTNSNKPDKPPEVTVTTPKDAPAGYGTTAYSADAAANGVYTFAQIETIITTTSLRLALPVAITADDEAKKKDTVSICRVGPKVSMFTIRGSAERNASWPKMTNDLDYKKNGITYTLLKSTYNLRAPTTTQNKNNPFYAADWELHYAMSRALLPDENLPVASLPWSTLTPANTPLKPESLLPPANIVG